ncbi:MAG: hypothetical protein FJX54_22435 [Alphaproteobacteria bacterium]|nr:hypothetical protein [Alphaproteobacteria bacterium]
MLLNFAHDGHAGAVDVRIGSNDDPSALACGPGSLGLPVCTATVTSGAAGYHVMCGWVQLVRSSDNRSGGSAFEIDPFALFADADWPYAFYGHLPTLFDAPSRSSRQDMDWLAHAFLAKTPLEKASRRVVALTGFSWGFTIRDGEVASRSPAPLTLADWQAHVPLLRERNPGWDFGSNS